MTKSNSSDDRGSGRIQREDEGSLEGIEESPNAGSQTPNLSLDTEITVIDTPSGKQYILNPLSADHYFDYQSKIQSDTYLADIWLITKAYRNIETGNHLMQAEARQLDFDDLSSLMSVFSSFDGFVVFNDNRKSIKESKDFTIGKFRITQRELGGSLYSKFRHQLSQGIEDGFRWFITAAYLIDGKPITDDDLSNPFPLGIGFVTAAILVEKSIGVLKKPHLQSTQF